jgi:hypothetical protein
MNNEIITRAELLSLVRESISSVVKDNNNSEDKEFNLIIHGIMNILNNINKMLSKKYDDGIMITWNEITDIIPEWYILNNITKQEMDKKWLI